MACGIHTCLSAGLLLALAVAAGADPVPRALPLSILCPFEPALDCRTSLLPARSKLTLRRRAENPKRDRLSWRSAKGETTPVGDLGDPTDDTFYELCLYTKVDDRPVLLLHPDAMNGPGWKATRQGYRYKAKAGENPDGLRKLRLRGGASGRVKFVVRGKGLDLAMTPLPIPEDAPLVAQLHNSLGLCWEAIYSDPPRRNTESIYRHISD